MLGNQQQRRHRGLPFIGVFRFGQFGDEKSGIAERNERFSARQRNRNRRTVDPTTD
jgi:hypothetical protein